MCDKCGSKKCGKVRYWLHIADGWTVKEIKEMRNYLDKLLMEKIGISKEMIKKDA